MYKDFIEDITGIVAQAYDVPGHMLCYGRGSREVRIIKGRSIGYTTFLGEPPAFRPVQLAGLFRKKPLALAVQAAHA